MANPRHGHSKDILKGLLNNAEVTDIQHVPPVYDLGHPRSWTRWEAA